VPMSWDKPFRYTNRNIELDLFSFSQDLQPYRITHKLGLSVTRNGNSFARPKRNLAVVC